MTFCKKLLVISLSVLAGCKVEPPGSAANGSHFIIEEVRAASEAHTEIQPGDFEFLRTKTFHLEYCLRESTSLQALANQKLTLGTETRTTDARGCATVPLKISYNVLIEESLVEWPVDISVEGSFKGSQRIVLGVNPWSGLVVDTRYVRDPAPRSEPGKVLEGNLIVQRFDLSLINESYAGGAGIFDYQLDFEPHSLRKDLRGSHLEEAIEKGAYEIRAEVWEVTERGSEWIASAEPVSGQAVSGRVRTQLKVKFDRRPTFDSSLEWRIFLKPSGQAPGLSDFAGSKTILRSQIRGNFSLPVRAIQMEEGSPESRVANPERAPGFYFHAQTRLRFSRRTEDFNRDSAETFFDYEICLANYFDESPVAYHSIELSISPRNGIEKFYPVETDSRGCLIGTYPEPIVFSYFSGEEYLPYQIRARSKESPFEGTESTLAVHLNPWKQNEHFFKADREGEIPKNPRPGDVEIRISNASCTYPRQHHDLRVDVSMNLTFLDFYQCPVGISLYRPFSFGAQEGGSGESLMQVPAQMKFRVKTVLTGAMLDEAEQSKLRYISEYETEASAESLGENRNRIVSTFAAAHDFSEKRLFYSFTRLYIQVEPIGPSRLKPFTVWTHFSPFSREEIQNLVLFRSELSIEELRKILVPSEHFEMKSIKISDSNRQALVLERGELRKPRKIERGHTSFEWFLEEVELPRMLSVVDFGAADMKWPNELNLQIGTSTLEERLRQLLSKTSDSLAPEKAASRLDLEFQVYLRPLCRVFLRNHPLERKACDERPLDFIRADLLEFVEGIHDGDEIGPDGPARWMGSETGEFAFRMRVFKEIIETLRVHEGTSLSESDTHGVASKMGLELGGTGSSLTRNYSYGKDAFWGTEFAKTRDDRARVEAMKVNNLKETTTKVFLDLEVKNCIFIRPGKKHPAPVEQRSYFLCLPLRSRFIDSWHSIVAQAQVEGSRILEQMDPDNRFLKLIRGRLPLEEFQRIVADRTRSVVLEHVPELNFGPSHLLNDIYRKHRGAFGTFADGGVFPGVSRYRSIPSENY